ncbi:E3 ubiquitin/ISG15 ligase TRIM25-like isoform X1 [Alosa alosa]|uniref:E3 ubiquitin/ISG15 ligase TRIM25-like isoform X1 n=2 Tax=Alosa alosa TaxID=278164 RepID=UPI0020154001|nr:E3 ubiquitin/ISG15 ligase TRIM25-like isoform X1 [Alosa alosa]
MAEANISVDENHFQCPICLELLKDPVTIPCGHSYCMECITKGWDIDDEKGVYGCPQCRQTFNPRPVLGKNPILANMVAKLKTHGLQSIQSDGGFAEPGDVDCTVCIGRKRKADLTCLECLDSYCATHLCRHEELFLGKKHKMVKAVVDIQARVCSQHNKPLEVFCQTDEECVCVECITEKHQGHDVLSPARAQEHEKRIMELSLQSEISKRESELNKLTENVEPLKSFAQAAVEHSDSVFTELQAFIEQKRVEVAEMIRTQKEAELSRAEQLQEELNVLKKRAADMAQLASTEDYIHFLQSLSSFSPKDLPAVTVSECFSFDGVKTSVSHLKDMVNETCTNQVGLVQRSVKFAMFQEMTRYQLKKYSCYPKLDEDTAHRHHLLSEKGTKLEWSHNPTYRRDYFRDCRQALCSEGLSRRAYWEVEWDSPFEIYIAVAYHDIARTGTNSRFGFNNKSWCLGCKNSCLTFSHNNVETEIPGQAPSKIGVYLDHQAGILAFYGITNCDSYTATYLIYRVHARFTEPLFPGFYLSRGQIKLF